MNALMLICLLIPLYAFIGYPLLLSLPFVARGRGRNARATYQPSFSVLVAVYNEEKNIVRKIKNFLDLEYPSCKLEMIIVSDGSSDATERLAAPFLTSGLVRLLRQNERRGKTEALNLAVAQASGDILLFTDADALLRPDCVARLAEAMADPEVGLAGGRSVYIDAAGRETGKSLYRRYEEWIKAKEGRAWGIVGADGAVYAMRRELYTPLPPQRINDLAHPAEVVMAGKRAVAAPEALAFETDGGDDETARQTRIMAQSWLIVFQYFTPLLKNGRLGYLWQLVSHKPLRWLTLPLLGLCALAALAARGPLAGVVMAWLAVFALAAFWGRNGKGGRAARLAWLFYVQHAAAVRGLVRLARGHNFITWTPRGD